MENRPSGLRPYQDAEVAELARRFRRAEPFPHLVIDDFLSPQGIDAARAFPDATWPHWHLFRDEYQKQKHTCNDLTTIPRPLTDLIHECSGPSFLSFLSKVTGIQKLLPDPYLEGGGLHGSGEGGVLTPHTDFHLYKRLNLYRAINLLVYLNDDWSDQDGGALELYRKGETTPRVKVPPVMGRAVIFLTDDRSVHGFLNPVGPGKWRRSVALYYYTACETQGFSGDTTTHWQTRGQKLKGVRLAAYESLIFLSRAFSKLAHVIDPNRNS
jgi:hypothetical protein